MLDLKNKTPFTSAKNHENAKGAVIVAKMVLRVLSAQIHHDHV